MKERLLYDNLCKRDKEYDTKHLYTVRREKLNPWFPLDNILHISGVGMFECAGNVVKFSNMNRQEGTVELDHDPYAIARLAIELTDGQLSYQDIMICLNKELSVLFNSSTGRFEKLDEYPDINVERVYPAVIYEGDGFYFFSESGKVGFKTLGMLEFVTAELPRNSNPISMLSICASYLGYNFTRGKVCKI